MAGGQRRIGNDDAGVALGVASEDLVLEGVVEIAFTVGDLAEPHPQEAPQGARQEGIGIDRDGVAGRLFRRLELLLRDQRIDQQHTIAEIIGNQQDGLARRLGGGGRVVGFQRLVGGEGGRLGEHLALGPQPGAQRGILHAGGERLVAGGHRFGELALGVQRIHQQDPHLRRVGPQPQHLAGEVGGAGIILLLIGLVGLVGGVPRGAGEGRRHRLIGRRAGGG